MNLNENWMYPSYTCNKNYRYSVFRSLYITFLFIAHTVTYKEIMPYNNLYYKYAEIYKKYLNILVV